MAARSPSSVCVGGSRTSSTAASTSGSLQCGVEVGGVVDGGGDGESVALEELGEAGTEEGVVLGEDKAHGTSRVTIVGPPTGLETIMVPSKARSRLITPVMPVPPVGSAPPRPSSPTSTRSTPSAWPSRIHAFSACGVLADVGQALGHREVDRRLDRGGTAARRVDASTRTGTAMSSASACDRADEAAVGQHRRMDAAHDRAQLAERRCRSSRERRRPACARRPGRCSNSLVGHAEAQRERDQPRLRAVVQVALEPAQLGRRVVDGVGAGLGQLLDPALEPLGDAGGEQPLVERRDRSRISGPTA